MIVYRVEHKKTKEGPYNCVSIDPFLDSSASIWHPISVDLKNRASRRVGERAIYTGAIRYGFMELSHLYNWFSRLECTKLIEFGYVINVYVVSESEIFSDDIQCIYVHSKAGLRETLRINPNLSPISPIGAIGAIHDAYWNDN